MVALTDLLSAAARSEAVEVLGVSVECRSLTLREIASLMQRLPAVQALFGAGAVEEAGSWFTVAPDAAAAVIAAGIGHPGPEGEMAVEKLPFEAQLDLLAAVLRQTAPSGIVPLVQRVTALLGADAATLQAATASASIGPGKAPDGNSPPGLNGSAPAVTD